MNNNIAVGSGDVEETVDGGDVMGAVKAPGLLRAANLTKSFITERGEVSVLRNVNFAVAQGEQVAVVGESGSGKTTLMHILGTLDKPTSGTCFFESTDLFALSRPKLDHFRNQHLGFVFQFHQLLPEFTALENVMMPALIAGNGKNGARQKAEKLLSETGLQDRFDHKPGQLSGGEQQRVAIARALVLQPKLLIADEPTGNLDSATSDDIYALLQRLHLAHNLTMIIVTHNMDLARRMDRVVRIHDGCISECCVE